MRASLTQSPIQLLSLPSPILIIGAAYTGKSSLAHTALHPEQVTAVIGTADLKEPLLRHRVTELQRERPQHWQQEELEDDLGRQLEKRAQVCDQVLVDSLNQWVAHRLLHNVHKYTTDQLTYHIESEASALYKALQNSSPRSRIVLVSSEVGAGVTPPRALAQIFRQVVSRINCRIAALCSSVVLVSSGIPLLIKGDQPEPAAPSLSALK